MAIKFTKDQLFSSITRMFSGDDAEEVLGAGFLIPGGQVVTCAHVFDKMLKDKTVQAEVHLDFVVAKHPPLRARATILKKEVDIVWLELRGEPPPAAQPLCLWRVERSDLWGHDCAALGFPGKAAVGRWAYGQLSGPVKQGDWVQVDRREGKVFIEKGYSGTPVWDEVLEGVVGIVVALVRRVRQVQLGYMIPTCVLEEVWEGPLTQLVCDVDPTKEVPSTEAYITTLLTEEKFKQQRQKFIEALALLLGTDPDEIEVEDIEPAGSIRVRLRIPKAAASRLHRMALIEGTTLPSLGITNLMDESGLPDPNNFPSRFGASKMGGEGG